jgi:hypothetical protein
MFLIPIYQPDSRLQRLGPEGFNAFLGAPRLPVCLGPRKEAELNRAARTGGVKSLNPGAICRSYSLSDILVRYFSVR